MVTSRQVARGIGRTVRAMERSQKAAQRRNLAYAKAAEKAAQLQAAAEAVADYEEIVAQMVGAHRISYRRRDWHSVAATPNLSPAVRGDVAESEARRALDCYQPNWVARTFRLEKRQRAALEAAIERGRAKDERDFHDRVDAVTTQNARIDHARLIVARDRETMGRLLSEDAGIGSLPYSVEAATVTLSDDGRVILKIDGLDLEDMPTESISLLKSGKASIKAITPAKVAEMHFEAICSAALRVALEVLQILPIDEVEIVMLTDLLDRGTGHISASPVLYVRVADQAIASLNLGRTDASALIDRLGGHHEWGRRDGFKAINLGAYGISADAIG